jgi:hypothetical protein
MHIPAPKMKLPGSFSIDFWIRSCVCCAIFMSHILLIRSRRVVQPAARVLTNGGRGTLTQAVFVSEISITTKYMFFSVRSKPGKTWIQKTDQQVSFQKSRYISTISLPKRICLSHPMFVLLFSDIPVCVLFLVTTISFKRDLKDVLICIYAQGKERWGYGIVGGNWSLRDGLLRIQNIFYLSLAVKRKSWRSNPKTTEAKRSSAIPNNTSVGISGTRRDS